MASVEARTWHVQGVSAQQARQRLGSAVASQHGNVLSWDPFEAATGEGKSAFLLGGLAPEEDLPVRVEAQIEETNTGVTIAATVTGQHRWALGLFGGKKLSYRCGVVLDALERSTRSR